MNMSFLDQIDKNNLPAHVAIIMDGNGRWAKAKGLPRTAGHAEGVEVVRKITSEATRLGLKYLTLYTFSTENWNRPVEEVKRLMELILENLEEEIFMKNNVRFRVIGDLSRLPDDVRAGVQGLIDRTAGNNRMTVVIALSYSSRWEIIEAAKRVAQEAKAGLLEPEAITEESFANYLQTCFMPDPDLLIRTGGEQRISNYLLWQCAYSEFYFCNTYWPDFDEECLHKAIVDYQSRQRRYGKTEDQIVTDK